ncbi:MAG TPA: hypothetical protein VMN39_05320 [Longimicrobiaceae bacterium]|nr:hypothetical protein [Longimicrobiaceae bacterium]
MTFGRYRRAAERFQSVLDGDHPVAVTLEVHLLDREEFDLVLDQQDRLVRHRCTTFRGEP